MKKSILAILAISLISTTSCRKQVVVGGPQETEKRTIPVFNSVDHNGSFNVKIYESDRSYVIVNAPRNIIEHIKTRTIGKTLVLENDAVNYGPHGKVTIEVYTPNLEELILNGSGNLNVDRFSDLKNIHAELKGSGNINFSTNTADFVNLKLTGSGKIAASDIATDSTIVRLTGSGKVECYSNHYLKADLDGSGTIIYWGNPTWVLKEVSGSGNIKGKG